MFAELESLTLASLRLSPGCSFEVPTRVAGGKGALRIEGGNVFGALTAPRLGDGTILIQPRSPEAEILIGSRNSFSNNVTLCANERIVIGDGCLIGDGVCIYDCDFHEVEPTRRSDSFGPTHPVLIGNNVWLGSRVVVLKGVTIGDNTAVGAMSLVTRSIPPNSVAVGNPARVARAL